MADKRNIPDFPFAPSQAPGGSAAVGAAIAIPVSATGLGVPVGSIGDVPAAAGMDRAALQNAGFDGTPGSALLLPARNGPVIILFGIGDPASTTAADLRRAGAAVARGGEHLANLAIAELPVCGLGQQAATQAVAEGVLLARYRYEALRRTPKRAALAELTMLGTTETLGDVARGAEAARLYAGAQNLARDLANTPHSHLTATKLGRFAQALGAARGFTVELFDKPALEAMGCGGLLGVNAGSVEQPCMVKISWRPPTPRGHLALVGKGIMYDSGGISLKPSDRVHAQMKNDMSGAAVILAAVAALAELGSDTAITAFLMCTDNMPSGTATGLGDVLTIRGGKTVEVIDTDAEGRLVLADGLVLATEEGVDAIVDVATLTGSVLRALGPDMAGVFGTDQNLVDLVKAAAEVTGEQVWQLPLHRPYLRMIESGVADLANCAPVGKPDGIIAALFMAEFVGDVPWAHIDICGTAQNDEDMDWQRAGCSGFGARLLIELAERFERSRIGP